MPEYHKAENFNIIDDKPHLIFSLRGWNLRLIDTINFVVCLMFCLPTKNISVFKVFENAAKEICWNLKYLFSSWTFKSFTPPEKEPSIFADTQVFTVHLYLSNYGSSPIYSTAVEASFCVGHQCFISFWLPQAKRFVTSPHPFPVSSRSQVISF